MELFIIKSQLRLTQWASKKLAPKQWVSKQCAPHQFPSNKGNVQEQSEKSSSSESTELLDKERGDVPGWVLVVLMTTGLVTAIWTIAAPRLSTILRNSLDAMNGIR